MFMPTIREFREKAGLSLSELARLANVDYKTAKKADDQRGAIQRIKAVSLVRVLGERLSQSLTVEQIDGLEIH